MNFIKIMSHDKDEVYYINPEAICFIADRRNTSTACYSETNFVVYTPGETIYLDEAGFQKLTKAINFTVTG